MDLHIPKSEFSSPIGATSRHTVFEVLLLIIIIALFYWFIVKPKQTELAGLNTQYQQLSDQEAKLEANKQKLTDAIADMANHPDAVAALDEALPLDNRVTKLYIVLESLTKSSVMTVGDINVAFPNSSPMAGDRTLLANPYSAKRTLQKLSTGLDVVGTFDQFQGLLKKIESSGRLINVTGIDIKSSTGVLLDFKLSLESYYYN